MAEMKRLLVLRVRVKSQGLKQAEESRGAMQRHREISGDQILVEGKPKVLEVQVIMVKVNRLGVREVFMETWSCAVAFRDCRDQTHDLSNKLLFEEVICRHLIIRSD